MIWNTNKFIKSMKLNKYAFLTGNVKYYELDSNTNFVKNSNDLFIIENIMKP